MSSFITFLRDTIELLACYRCSIYRVARKNVPNFALMLYCSAVEFKQKGIIFLKSNYCWTVPEIMTLYVFVLTVKYAKEYWVSATYKITNKFNTSHCMRSISSHSDLRKMCWVAPPFCFLTAFSRFSIVQWIFELSQCPLILFLIASLRSCIFANESRRPLYTKSCRISQMQ